MSLLDLKGRGLRSLPGTGNILSQGSDTETEDTLTLSSNCVSAALLTGLFTTNRQSAFVETAQPPPTCLLQAGHNLRSQMCLRRCLSRSQQWASLPCGPRAFSVGSPLPFALLSLCLSDMFIK